MDNLYVEFKVEVSDREWSYQGRHGDATVKIQVPREILLSIDPGNLFVGALQAAMSNFDNFEVES